MHLTKTLSILGCLLLALFCCAAAAEEVQEGQNMPLCAKSCYLRELDTTICKVDDLACQCADVDFSVNVAICVGQSCTPMEILTATNVSATRCQEPVRSRQNVSIRATLISGILAIIFVILRMFDFMHRRRFWIADGLAVLAMVSAIPMDVLEFYMVANGFGKDMWTLSRQQIINVVKYTWLTQIFYSPVVGLTKISILFFFLDVFPERRFRLLCHATICHCVFFTLAILFGTIFSNSPIQHTWLSWTGEVEGSSIDTNIFWWSQAAVNIATDLWILILPIPTLVGLNLGLKRKLYILLMFSVGLFITIISIIRLTGLVTYSNTTNPTYNNVGAATWSVTEAHVSIICSCMPSARSWIALYLPRVFGGSTLHDDEQQQKQRKYHHFDFRDNHAAIAVRHEFEQHHHHELEGTGKRGISGGGKQHGGKGSHFSLPGTTSLTTTVVGGSGGGGGGGGGGGKDKWDEEEEDRVELVPVRVGRSYEKIEEEEGELRGKYRY